MAQPARSGTARSRAAAASRPPSAGGVRLRDDLHLGVDRPGVSLRAAARSCVSAIRCIPPRGRWRRPRTRPGVVSSPSWRRSSKSRCSCGPARGAASWSSSRRSAAPSTPVAARGRCRRPARRGRPCAMARSTTSASTRTSARARFSPLAPVGGTVCAASPASSSRPLRIGVWTKERNGSTVRSMIGPSSSSKPSGPASRACSSLQIRSSDQASTSSSGSHWKYIRCTVVGALADQREAAVGARVDQLRRARRAPRTGSRTRRTGTPGSSGSAPATWSRQIAAGAVGADDEVGAHLVRPPVGVA